MAKKQNNKKRKKTGGGKGSCLGGKRSFSSEGRATKRARKIARNIARDQAKQMAELQESLVLEARAANAVDWNKSDLSIRQRNKLKRYRKAHQIQAPTSQNEADASSTSSSTSSFSSTSNAPSTTVALWLGTIPNSNDPPTLELKQLRKSLGIRVTGASCPPPIEHVTDERLPSLSFGGLWKYDRPTPVQRQLWPAALCGLDIMAVAPTGSGKTLAYILPAVAYIRHMKEEQERDGDTRGGDGRASAPRGLVCVPTRELATQVVEVCTRRLRLKKKANIR
jgi:Rad3-related DNA helicase